MFSTIRIYLKQRFNPLIFGGLTLFLFLFAKGHFDISLRDLFILPFLLICIFIFRLFDDLQNKDFDRKEHSERIYTQTLKDKELNNFLLIISTVFLAMISYFNWRGGFILLLFLALNFILYRALISKWKFRFLLPLLKYPLFCFLLMFAMQNQLFLNTRALLFCLSVFPAFVLFESLNDKRFYLQNWQKHILFFNCFFSFLPIIFPESFNIFSLIFIVLSYFTVFFIKTSGSAYIFLSLFLLTRITHYYGV